MSVDICLNIYQNCSPVANSESAVVRACMYVRIHMLHLLIRFSTCNYKKVHVTTRKPQFYLVIRRVPYPSKNEMCVSVSTPYTQHY